MVIEELWNAPKALVSALASQATGKHVLILTGGSTEEVRLFHDFALFTEREVIDFPAWETLPSENIPPSPDIVGDRYRALEYILTSKEPVIMLSGLQACLQKLIPPAQFQALYLHLKIGDSVGFEKLQAKLVEMGYQRCSLAADKGEFAVRGGIIDVFPVSSPDPFRLEFWGDDVETMRIYDPIGQTSIHPVEEITLTAAQEMELVEGNTSLKTILDYLGPETLIIWDDLLALEDRYATLLSFGASPAFLTIAPFLEKALTHQTLFLSQKPLEELSEVKMAKGVQAYSMAAPMHEVAFEMFNRPLNAWRWRSPFQTLAEALCPDIEEPTGAELLQAASSLKGLHFLAATPLEESTFVKQLAEFNIHHYTLSLGYLSSGFYVEDLSLTLFPQTEWTHRYKIRRQKQRSTYHTPAIETYELLPGDLVVHMGHGIGKFLGMEKKPNAQGQLNEHFQFEYADGARLFVPLNQAHLISKYIGSTEEIPELHALGSGRWKKTKEQTQKAILGYAAELLQLYAERDVVGGFPFSPDSADMHAFEGEFPFVETEDQLAAIAAVKENMQTPKPMDRLVCGDVGYGKTEVAMRAAFKAVVDGGKQVAILVPTTVLAMQHYENFVARMANFPIRIGVLSRFRTAKEIKVTLQELEEGKLDIVIGTHRIISQDVKFKDLGLLIIDEEQRFGVRAKEHLKKRKQGIDCLTLSATPIPRTLYMSLVGARDLSVINTPPQDRLPIKTILAEPAEQLLKTALLRELARDGQAFVIHNRVETIHTMADQIQKVLPQARIVVGHGQMAADELDAVFHAFKSGQADILVATTIVENGIDIPNANTILIDRADRFGLADLYQMRGRVGRWNRRAYAYFLVPNLRTLPELSRKRLNALAEASGYGGGMKVAMRDLEIRGAGNILGEAQSGHVASVGFHLYCKMLKRTIQTMQGKIPAILTDVKIDLPLDARLPEDYINEMSLRMEFYQRLGEVTSIQEIDLLWKEIQDRFGAPPLPAQWLYFFSKLRLVAATLHIISLKQEKTTLLVEKKGETRRLLFNPAKVPQELETKLIPLLQKEFS